MSRHSPPMIVSNLPDGRVGRVARHPRAGFAVCEFALPAGYRMDPHEHDRAGLVVPLAGSWRGSSEAGVTEAAGETVVVLPEGMPHRESTGPEGSRCLLVTVERSPGRAAIDLERPGERTRPDLVRLGRHLRREIREEPVDSLLVESLLLGLFEARPEPPLEDPAKAPPWMRRVVELVHDRYADPLTHEEIAGEAGVSREHLARTFRRVTGLALGAWVRRLRVQEAARRLQRDDGSLGQIAHGCGFADQSHMTRVFRGHFATTPGAYRRRLSGESSRVS